MAKKKQNLWLKAYKRFQQFWPSHSSFLRPQFKLHLHEQFPKNMHILNCVCVFCLLTFICVFLLICTEFMFGNFYVKLLLRWLRFRNEWKRCASTNHLTIHLAIYPHTSALPEMHFRVKICKYDEGDDDGDEDISSSRNMGIFIGLWVLQCSTLVRKNEQFHKLRFSFAYIKVQIWIL